MIESREQTGHRRMIPSALASAQSAFSLLCAAESGIKTIVQMGLCPGCSDRPKILPRAEPSPLSKISPEKEYRILRHASYLHRQPPYIGRLRDPNERPHPDVNRLRRTQETTSFGSGTARGTSN